MFESTVRRCIHDLRHVTHLLTEHTVSSSFFLVESGVRATPDGV